MPTIHFCLLNNTGYELKNLIDNKRNIMGSKGITSNAVICVTKES